MSKQDNGLYPYILGTLICSLTATFLATLNLLDLGIFYSTMEEFVDKYFTSTTPQMTTSAIMFSTLYTFNVLTLGGLAITCHYFPKHCPSLTLHPTPTPKSFFCYWVISFLCSITWSLNFHYDRIVLAWLVQVVACIALWKAYFISARIVDQNKQKYKSENPRSLWLIYAFVHNAVAFYAVWSFVTSIVSFGSVLVYVNSFGEEIAHLRGIWSMEEGSTIGLLTLMIYTVGVLVVEQYTHKHYFRHVFAISPAFVVSWGGLITRMYVEKRGFNVVVGAIGFSISIIAMMYKLYLTAIEIAKESNGGQRTKQK